MELMKAKEVLAIVKVSKPTLYKWMGRGIFPKPVRIGVSAVAWRKADVDAWHAALAPVEYAPHNPAQ